MRRWAAAVVALGGTWILACERWSADGDVAAFLVAWAAIAAAFLAPLQRGRVATARLAAALLAVDVVFDVANPDARIVLRPLLEAARVAILFGVDTALVRYAPPRLLAAILRLAATGLVVLVGAVAVYVLVDGGREDPPADADAILVLGYALRPDGAATPSLVARVDRAASIATRAPIVVSGHASAPGRTEADAMRELLIARGVSADRVVLEPAARTTVENFACAAPILRAHDASRVLLVTERWHMTRSTLLASRLAPEVAFLRAPAPSPSARIAAFRAIREAGGILAELVRPTSPRTSCQRR